MPDVLCSICYDSLVQKEGDVIVTDCGHLFHQNCLSKWRSHICAECRSEIQESGKKKVYLICFEQTTPLAPISDEVLMTTNTNLLSQLTEKAVEMENMVAICSHLELEICSLQKECDKKIEKIRNMEKVVAGRNKTISSKEQNIRVLQSQLKDLKLKNGALKKSNNEIAIKLKDQKALDANMKYILMENQRLQRQILNAKSPQTDSHSPGNKKTMK
ncbi:E3 ubiquitin-protein ligase TRAIP-like [Contarinia nasturtii]|uniref:E3 ubiquitin-protein ligase TRAIP-like n=1 Tax=Contarinia nasturtii TaxID=265458 RepID=UPI0012D3D55A|nr:E3 ubiquitin-protein ligase TRAIP-like [Contarinia nasturtii]